MKTIRMTTNPVLARVTGCLLLAMASSSFAASTWTDMGNTCSTSGGTVVNTADTGNNPVYIGNTGSCGTSSSVTLTAQAYSTTSGPMTPGTVFADAEVHKWGGGLGVVNRYENPLAGGPHATDNQYGTDAIRLSFSSQMNLTNVGLGWVGGDSDFSVLAWVGPGTPAGAVVGKTLTGAAATSTLLTQGWQLVANVAGPGNTNNNISAASAGIYSSYWLISAYNTAFNGGFASATDDYFKLFSVAGNTKPPGGQAPEPGSLALMGVALAGVMTLRRRRTATQ